MTRIHDDASGRVLEAPQRAAPAAAEPIAAGHLLTGLPTARGVRGLGDAGRRGVLSLQRTAGNSAVAALFAVGRAVQREGEGEIPPNPYDEPSAPTGGGPITSDGGTTTINGGAIVLNAGMTSTGGVIRASTIIADSVVASAYSPGAGNVW